MTLPTLPTDNLYKFLAFFGLIVGLAGFYFPEIKKFEMQEDMYKYDVEIAKFITEEVKFQIERQKIKNIILKYHKRANITDTVILNDSVTHWVKVGGKASEELVQQGNNIAKLLEDLQEKKIELNSKKEEFDSKTKIIRLQREEVNRLNEIINIILPFSIMLMIIGFVLWYIKSQRLQDLILKEQYTTAAGKTIICQSCGMALQNDEKYQGLDDDSKKTLKYCGTCYDNSAFTEPALTKVKMGKKIRDRLLQLGHSKLAVYFWYLFQSDKYLDKLDRWRKPFKWH